MFTKMKLQKIQTFFKTKKWSKPHHEVHYVFNLIYLFNVVEWKHWTGLNRVVHNIEGLVIFSHHL